MHPLMQEAGHRLIVPTYTGLGEREHLASPAVNLETHIQDLLGVIKFEELENIVLVAHSYGGMVATGVVDRVPEHIRQLIHVDAFVPRDGQSLFNLLPDEALEQLRQGLVDGDGWRVPPMPVPADTSKADRQWIERFRMAQPLHCFDQPLQLVNGDTRLRRGYIKAQRLSPGDPFVQFAERAQQQGWDYRGIDASHSAHVTAPRALMSLLGELTA